TLTSHVLRALLVRAQHGLVWLRHPCVRLQPDSKQLSEHSHRFRVFQVFRATASLPSGLSLRPLPTALQREQSDFAENKRNPSHTTPGFATFCRTRRMNRAKS